MKRTAKIVISALLVLSLVLAFAACGGSSGGASNAAAGTYKGVWHKFVGDNEDAKVTNEEFSLVLEANGKGKFIRDGAEFDLTWKLDGENFSMTETFLGISNDYTGTLKDGKLDIFNGDPEEPFTCEYYFEK
ncbi:MAG: hypothetical protein IKP26_05375 [Clostridia bacterium]|nr:hypothetical protein [Clostridia bacterium]